MTCQATLPAAALVVLTVGQALLDRAAHIYVIGFLLLGAALTCHALQLGVGDRIRARAACSLASILYLPALLLLMMAEKIRPAVSVLARSPMWSG